MLWLALYCPTLSLDCILRRWPKGLDPALAVTDLEGTRRLIKVATRKAQDSGVFAGQSIATALSLLPDLVLIARKVEDERAALTEAALAALSFTPTVSLRSSGLVMEISSSLKLFGGRRALKQRLAGAMRVQGLAMTAAEAPTPHGAWLLAQDRARRRLKAERHPPRVREEETVPATSKPLAPPDWTTRLDGLSITHLETARPSLNKLEGIGVKHLAQLRRLPAQGLARRFGPDLIDELARAYGDKPDPQVLFAASQRFDTRIELMARVETAEALVFASQRLLAQMTGWLTARRVAVREFTLILHHDRWTRDAIEPTAVPIALSTPSSDLSRLETLVRERFTNLELKAPVLELSLAAPTVVEEQEMHGSLFPAREQAVETLARLLEKLNSRLGNCTMVRIERVADRQPERAWREVQGDVMTEQLITLSIAPSVGRPRAVKQTVGTTRARLAAQRITPVMNVGPVIQQAVLPTTKIQHSCSLGPRPVWLLVEPKQLETGLHSPVYESPIALVAGPERIEAGWWNDKPATRDYFIGENKEGRLVWIFKERLPTQEMSFWFLQGLFG